MKFAATAAIVLLLAATPALAQQSPASGEVIAVVQVHGNNATAADEIVALAGVAPGDPFTAATPGEVRARLLDSGRFEGVEVRKRFASIADLSRVALVIVVDEHPVRIDLPGVPGGPPQVTRRGLFSGLMVMPILDAEDGYGLTYGAQFTVPGVAGDRSRLSFPLSWGGRKRAGVEFERVLRRGPVTRATAGATIERRTNPAYEEEDTRRRLWGRAERQLGDLHVGTTIGWEDVSFGGEDARFASFGADVAFDTRIDPAMPRNAVYGRVSWTRLVGDATGTIDRLSLDGRAYLGLVGQAVVVVRAEQETADRALPRFLDPMLGGWSTVRGFAAGSFAADTRTTGAVELRLPVSSPLSFAKTGFSAFVDAGKSYDHGVRFRDATLRTGVGVGAWLSAAVVQAGVAVARGSDGDTRVHVGLGLTF